MPTYDAECTKCEARWVFYSMMEKRDEPQMCPECGSVGVRIPSMVAIAGIHSYRDGARREGAYLDLVEAAKLEKKAANLPADSAEKKGLMREASKLKEIKQK